MINWEAVGAIGEIVGAAAVVITLLFLIAQLRTNSRAVRAQIKQSLVDNVQSRFSIPSTDTAFAEIMVKVREGARFSELSKLEQEKYRFWVAAELQHVGNYYRQYQLGTITHSEYKDRMVVFVKQLKNTPAMLDFWEASVEFHGTDFKNAVNEELRDAL